MTRQELLRTVIRQARANGFQFRKWFQAAIEPDWISFDDSVEAARRGATLLFSPLCPRICPDVLEAGFSDQLCRSSGQLYAAGQGGSHRNSDPQAVHPPDPESRRMEISLT